jgi:hypothetical protein
MKVIDMAKAAENINFMRNFEILVEDPYSIQSELVYAISKSILILNEAL